MRLLLLAESCRFRDCKHGAEPGCAVAGALADGRLAADRWNSYRKLLGEARRHELMADPLAAIEQKNRWKAIHKAAQEILQIEEIANAQICRTGPCHNRDMEITWLGHGTFRFQLPSGQVILMDPWTDGNPAYPEGL